LLAGVLPWLRIANSKPQSPDLASRGSRSGLNDCPGALPAIGGGTGRSRRGLREATYNRAGLQSGLSATHSLRSDPLKTAKNRLCKSPRFVGIFAVDCRLRLNSRRFRVSAGNIAFAFGDECGI